MLDSKTLLTYDSTRSVIAATQRMSQKISSKTDTKYLELGNHNSLRFRSECGVTRLLVILRGINEKQEEDREPLELSLRKLPYPSILVKLRELYLEHAKDLEAVHCILLDLHVQDFPEKPCGLLNEKYQELQTQLGALHSHLLHLHAQDAAQELRALLEEACQRHERHLDELHQRLLLVFERPNCWDICDMWDPPSQETKLKKLHLGLLELHKQVARRDSLAYYPFETPHLSSPGRIEKVLVPDHQFDPPNRSGLTCIPDSSSNDSSEVGVFSSEKSLEGVEGGVPAPEFGFSPPLETQSMAKYSLSEAPIPGNDNLKAQSSQANGGLQPTLEHTEARSNTEPKGRGVSFTDIGRTIRSYIAQRFWEPALESDKVRVRWTCVSVSILVNPSFANPRSGVGRNYMMISQNAAPVQQQSWQGC